jgi:hypothetical protein
MDFTPIKILFCSVLSGSKSVQENIKQNTKYNSDLYFHETITLCNELPSFFLTIHQKKDHTLKKKKDNIIWTLQ